MKQSIWDKQTVVIAELAVQDVTDWTSPLPLVLPAKWNHYIGFYLPLIQEYFTPFLPYPYDPSDLVLTLESDNIQLNGTQIISHLFALFCQKQQEPIRVRCKIRGSQDTPKIDLKKHFKQTLKASTCIRYGKFGASVITVNMSLQNIDDMFTNFQKSNYSEYMGDKEEESTNLGYRFIVENEERIQDVPVRVMGKGWTIERSVPRKTTLERFWSQLKGDRRESLHLHGVYLKVMDIQIEKLEYYCHPDGFIYLTIGQAPQEEAIE